MRICIDMGHTPASTGASGYFSELTEDRAVGKRVIAELQKRGHTVYNSTPADNVRYPDEVNQRIAYANARTLDLFCSIHFNAFNGSAHGTEVLYFSGDATGKVYADRIAANIATCMNITNRGSKPKTTEVGVIKWTNATAILIEVCFCDSATDFNAYKNTSYDEIVKAICDGIEKKAYTKTVKPVEQQVVKEPEPDKEPAKGGQEKACECGCETLVKNAVADLEKRITAIENKDITALVIAELIKKLGA